MNNHQERPLNRQERRALKYRHRELEHMARINPFALPRPDRPVETRVFTERGITFSLALRRPDNADFMRAREQADRLIEDFITGSDVREAATFPDPEIKPSGPLFQFACLLQEMQAPEHPADAYPAIELIALSVRVPNEWRKVQQWVGELTGTWEHDQGNSPAARTD